MNTNPISINDLYVKYGLKPSTYRLSKRGLSTARKIRFKHTNHIVSTPGPMGSSVEDLIVGMKVMTKPNVHHLDPLTAPCPWDNDIFE